MAFLVIIWGFIKLGVFSNTANAFELYQLMMTDYEFFITVALHSELNFRNAFVYQYK